jgi:hypothetical protein
MLCLVTAWKSADRSMWMSRLAGELRHWQRPFESRPLGSTRQLSTAAFVCSTGALPDSFHHLGESGFSSSPETWPFSGLRSDLQPPVRTNVLGGSIRQTQSARTHLKGEGEGPTTRQESASLCLYRFVWLSGAVQQHGRRSRQFIPIPPSLPSGNDVSRASRRWAPQCWQRTAE